jgi:hypothetical protein
MQEALLRETFAMQQISGITDGIRRVVEMAAILAIRSGEERITVALLPAWRDAYV